MEHQEYIGFWKRLVASLVDSILIVVFTVPITYMMYGPQYFDANSTQMIHGPGDMVVNYLLPLVFVIGFWVYKMATPGKMLFEAVIVDAKTGGKPSMRQWIFRYLGYIVSTLPLLLGFLWGYSTRPA